MQSWTENIPEDETVGVDEENMAVGSGAVELGEWVIWRDHGGGVSCYNEQYSHVDF